MLRKRVAAVAAKVVIKLPRVVVASVSHGGIRRSAGLAGVALQKV